MSAAIDRHANNVVIGAGEFYIDLYDADDKLTGERYAGDTVAASLTVTTERATVFSGDGAVSTRLVDIARSISRTLTLTLHDISPDNLALFVAADAETASDTAAAVVDEEITVRRGRWYQLGVSAAKPGGVGAVSATPADTTVTNQAGTTIYTAGNDYTLDAARGRALHRAGQQHRQRRHDQGRLHTDRGDPRHRARVATEAGEGGRALPGDGASRHGAGLLRQALLGHGGRRDGAQERRFRAADPVDLRDPGADRRLAGADHRRRSRLSAMTVGEDQPPAEAAPDETEGTDELGVLFPDFDVEVRDPETGDAVTLTVREFRFLEGLEVQSEARPLIRELAGLVERAANGAEVGLIELNAAIGAHGALWLSLIARACGREVSWLAGLADADAHALHAAMWAVHGPFFTRRLVAGRSSGRESGENVALVRVFDELVRAGHGGDDGHRGVGERLTWRHIKLFWQAAEERRAEALAGRLTEA